MGHAYTHASLYSRARRARTCQLTGHVGKPFEDLHRQHDLGQDAMRIAPAAAPFRGSFGSDLWLRITRDPWAMFLSWRLWKLLTDCRRHRLNRIRQWAANLKLGDRACAQPFLPALPARRAPPRLGVTPSCRALPMTRTYARPGLAALELDCPPTSKQASTIVSGRPLGACFFTHVT